MSHQPHQPPKTFKFPETVYGKRKRSFQYHWFEKYPWLDYDVEEDSVTCVFCKRQKSNLLSEICKEETFLKTGYKNWKKATEKFDKHQHSKCHKSVLTYEVIVSQCRDALEMIDENQKKRRELNRRIFLTILETLQYLARQGLAVRGDDDNESNFIQLLRLQSKKFPELTDWLLKKTERYTSSKSKPMFFALLSTKRK